MKNLPIILALFLTIGIIAQTNIEFKYNAAGNRTSRKVITISPSRKGEIVEDQAFGLSFTLSSNPTAGKIIFPSLSVIPNDKYINFSEISN